VIEVLELLEVLNTGDASGTNLLHSIASMDGNAIGVWSLGCRRPTYWPTLPRVGS